MGIKDRLYAFITFKNLKVSRFEKACGLSNGFFSKIGGSINDGSLMLISNAFPELNIEWLRTGEGEMLMNGAGREPTWDDTGMLSMIRMMGDFIQLGKKNADANLMNAEANRLNAQNLERLITLLESKYV